MTCSCFFFSLWGQMQGQTCSLQSILIYSKAWKIMYICVIICKVNIHVTSYKQLKNQNVARNSEVTVFPLL